MNTENNVVDGKKKKTVKVTQWLDYGRLKMLYGIAILKGDSWYNVSEDKKPIFFYTKREAKDKAKEIESKLLQNK